MGTYLDATDAVAAALCHFFQANRPASDAKYTGWKDFINKNEKRVNKP
jgi:crossover junction endodeoxyribonuclease RuvC